MKYLRNAGGRLGLLLIGWGATLFLRRKLPKPGPPLPADELNRICEAYFRVAFQFDRRQIKMAAPEDRAIADMLELDWAISDPEKLWPVLLELVERAPDYAKEYISTGLVETLGILHRKRFFDRAVKQAVSSHRFHEAIYGWPHWKGLAQAIDAEAAS